LRPGATRQRTVSEAALSRGQCAVVNEVHCSFEARDELKSANNSFNATRRRTALERILNVQNEKNGLTPRWQVVITKSRSLMMRGFGKVNPLRWAGDGRCVEASRPDF
jgi:hypothetical protein